LLAIPKHRWNSRYKQNLLACHPAVPFLAVIHPALKKSIASNHVYNIQMEFQMLAIHKKDWAQVFGSG